MSWLKSLGSLFNGNADDKPSRALRERVAIRLEAIGGQGAHSAGKILGEAAVLGMGYSGNHFSSFGSEKRGSPVRSYVRFSRDRHPARSASPVVRPELLVIFHPSLIERFAETTAGSAQTTSILVASHERPEQILLPRGVEAREVATIDALRIANRARCGVNSVILGAISRLVPEIEAAKIEEAMERFFGRLSEVQREANRAGFKEGQDKIRAAEFNPTQASLEILGLGMPRLGWANAPIGGVIPHPGNTALRDLSASRRGTFPLLNRDACIHCGYCDMVCPDYCFVWEGSDGEAPHLSGIDYRYCKGCQKCVTACPMNALTAVPEEEGQAAELRVAKFPEMPAPGSGRLAELAAKEFQVVASEHDPERIMLVPVLSEAELKRIEQSEQLEKSGNSLKDTETKDK